MKKYILISDFSLTSNNRGTSALGYGAISFLSEKKYINDGDVIVNIEFARNPFHKGTITKMTLNEREIVIKYIVVSVYEYFIFIKIGISFGFTPFANLLRKLKLVAALNGGDGFADIYGTFLFKKRLPYTYIAMRNKTPLIIMPQTIGPFKNKSNYLEAKRILQYANKIYVRDKNFINELEKMGIKYELAKDLSAYMQPEPWNITIKPNAVGINVSGLAYSNNFLDTAGQFDTYPDLIDSLISHFQNKHIPVYLIPHAYNCSQPEANNDDMVACKEAFDRHVNKSELYFLNLDLTSPKVKYVINQMSFFCGTRMHANFAAIYTGVPVFGLAYSYKFAGAFEANGLSIEQTYMINNMKSNQIRELISKIDSFYNRSKK